MMGLVLSSVVVVVYAAWLVIALVACFCVFYTQLDPTPVLSEYRPSVVVIIPVRGVPSHLPELWQAICAQIYRPFRLVFAVESLTDAAYAALGALTDGPETEIVVAGATIQRGQKVHNQLAALQVLRPADAVVVFADADIVPAADWLARLIRGLEDPNNAAVAGYRWMFPTDQRWSTAFTCAANASIATLVRLRSFNVAWGGSTALRRETLEALDLTKCWDRAVLDDLPLTRAVRARGGAVYGPRDVLVPTPASYSWKEAFAFGRRQYLYARMYAPGHWVFAACMTTLPLIGWAVAVPLAVGGDKLAIAALLSVNFIDHLRARLRRRVPAKLWGGEVTGRMAWLDRWGTPAYLGLHAVFVWSALFGRTIAWSGRIYRLDARARVVKVASVPGAAASPGVDASSHGRRV
jgi:Glycosyl transferase family 21